MCALSYFYSNDLTQKFELFIDFKPKKHILTVILFQIEKDHLEWLKQNHLKIWSVLEALVSQDVTRKLYKMNDGFEKVLEQREQRERKALIKLTVRSVSLECIHTTSHGNIVSDNWLIEERARLMGCPHSKGRVSPYLLV